MTVVIDASMALAWLFERQSLEEAERADALLLRCGHEAWCVPPLWHLEVLNALVVAERRGVLESERSDLFLERLGALPIDTDPSPAEVRRDALFELARRFKLSAYDAAYLELSLRLGAKLASFDRPLAQAAQAAGCALV